MRAAARLTLGGNTVSESTTKAGTPMITAAGWYQDPEGVTRYWDGRQWTAHVAADTQQAQQATAYQQPLQPEYAVQYAQPQYQAQPYPGKQGYGVVYRGTASNGIGVAGFVVGIVSVFLPLIFGLAAGITGLILSIFGLTRSTITGRSRGLSIAGIVLSSVGILVII
ncbi:uncharacterized protein DUF2510 [Leucobacter luti]|uniref:Uncharacterized protein DUF2510 n=2 Tax=Leucobacter luti TaxID=340320 RepID=A0A4R6RTM3_9MICO|nr:uncharacterized protein DUF2510 [Leucobacter luti]